MKIQTKLTSVFFLAWLLIIFLVIFLSNVLIKRDYQVVEELLAKKDIVRAQHVFVETTKDIHAANKNLSTWDETYRFMQEQSKAYINANLDATTFQEQKINLLYFYDAKGNLLFAREYDLKHHKFAPNTFGVTSSFHPDSRLLQFSPQERSHDGILQTSLGYFFVSCQPILPSNGKGLARGTLVVGRFLDQKEWQLLSDLVGLPVNFLPLEQIKQDSLRQIFATLIRGDKFYVVPRDNKTSDGYVLLHDIYGNAIGLLAVAIPRDMWAEAVKTIDFYIAVEMFGAIIILAMMWWLLRSQIVKRLLQIDEELITIAKSSKFSQRIRVSGSDELADIPRSINVLLDVIQASQEELENRVQERTQELEQANVGLKKEIELRAVVETKLRADEKLMEHMARHDALTGLPNRMLFNEFLLREIAKAKRYKTGFAILFLDLDKFKKINDALGHSAGDKYLQLVANELSNKLRSTDIVARLGGDEFLFYIGDFKQLFDLEKIAQKILEVIYTPRIILQQEVALTGSIGIAVYPSDGLTFEELISNADVAMYRAKSSGGNQVFFFKEVMNLQAKSNLKLEGELRQALKEQQLTVHFQPIISLHDKTLQGLETLVRWKHPTLGLLMPDKFISLAEKSNLIVSLNEVVMRQAFAARKKWIEQGLNPGFLTINVSALQFRSRGFLENLSKLMEEFSIEGRDIIFEITESTLMESEELSTNILKALHAMEIKIAIDDFGTGYSSLSYLQKFSIHYLKIDQEFVKNIPNDKDSEAITNAVIVLGHSLHLKTIAEGVETKEQFDYLRAHSCDMVQGYLISRPASEENTAELLKSNTLDLDD